MVLTASQQMALNKINDFLDSDKKVFILTGQTGTDKPQMVEAIRQLAAQRGMQTKLMAATGAAVRVMQDVVDEGAKKSVQTIHRSIYQRAHDDVDVNDQGNQITAVRLKFPIMLDTQTRLFIVYGAAMISNHENAQVRLQFGTGRLLDDLMAATGIHNRPAQIIMIGDEYQLPAADASTPLALSMAYYREKKLSAEKYELTIQSPAANQLVSTCRQLAAMISDPTKQRVPEFTDDQRTLFNLDRRYTNDQDRQKAIIDRFTERFRRYGPGFGCVVTDNNGLANDYNQQIRQQLGLTGQLTVGDLLYFTRNQYDLPLTTSQGPITMDVFAGTTIRITAVGDEREYVNKQCRLRFRQVQFFFLDDQARTIYTAEMVTNLLVSGEPRLSDLEALGLYQDLYDRFKQAEPTAMDDFRAENRQIESDAVHRCHDARTNEYRQEAVRLLKQLGVTLPDKEQLGAREYNRAINALVHAHPDADPRLECKRQKLPIGLKNMLKSDPYYSAIVAQYAYARNCYRAEEGQWPSVYVDFGHVGNASDHRLRFAYTALSCAAKWAVVRNVGSVFRKFKLNTLAANEDKLAKEARQANPLVPDQLRTLEHSLFERLQGICQTTGFTISGIDREPDKYYLMVYLTGPAVCRLQFYYSTKVGWTSANLAAGKDTIDRNQAFQSLADKLRQLEEGNK